MNETWLEFAVYSDGASAEVVAGLLRSESVQVRVAADEPVPGLVKGFRLMVPPDMLSKARWVLAQAQFSDEELAVAALAEPGDDSTGTPSKS
jgi:hypothetical protein